MKRRLFLKNLKEGYLGLLIILIVIIIAGWPAVIAGFFGVRWLLVYIPYVPVLYAISQTFLPD